MSPGRRPRPKKGSLGPAMKMSPSTTRMTPAMTRNRPNWIEPAPLIESLIHPRCRRGGCQDRAVASSLGCKPNLGGLAKPFIFSNIPGWSEFGISKAENNFCYFYKIAAELGNRESLGGFSGLISLYLLHFHLHLSISNNRFVFSNISGWVTICLTSVLCFQ